MQDDIDLSQENAALRARVAELETRIEKLERLADSDTLTPLPNRRFFFRAIERAVAQHARHGTPAALLFVDLDRLKEINDAHGHSTGDQALIHTAWVLREKVRGSDVVARRCASACTRDMASPAGAGAAGAAPPRPRRSASR